MPLIIEVSKTFWISAAHRLPKHAGKCFNPHGHNYKIVLFAEGVPNIETGMIIDFYDMKLHLDQIVGAHDHTDLNVAYGDKFETTAENLSRQWLLELRKLNTLYRRLQVFETDDSFAEARWV